LANARQRDGTVERSLPTTVSHRLRLAQPLHREFDV
jgi:hypothetical protein